MKSLILGGGLMLLGASPALAYDDPAVAVCEWVVKDYGFVSDANYERLSASIDRLDVILEYQTSPRNTAPRQRKYTCSFELKNNAFELIRNYEASDCEDMERMSKSDIEKLSTEELRASLEVTERCQDEASDKLSSMLEWNRDIEQPLMRMGLYPILEADTALGK